MRASGLTKVRAVCPALAGCTVSSTAASLTMGSAFGSAGCRSRLLAAAVSVGGDALRGQHAPLGLARGEGDRRIGVGEDHVAGVERYGGDAVGADQGGGLTGCKLQTRALAGDGDGLPGRQQARRRPGSRRRR